MRIAILIDKLKIGGVQKVAIEEARHLARLGHRVDLLVLWHAGVNRLRRSNPYEDLLEKIRPETLSDAFPRVFRFSFKFPGFDFFSWYHVTSPLMVPRILTKGRYDVIVSHGTYTCFTAYALWKQNGIPYIAFIWDPISYILPRAYSNTSLAPFLCGLRPFALGLDKILVENSLATLTGSRVHLPFFRRITRRHVEVLYPGCYPAITLPQKRGDYLLSVIRWTSAKRPERLVDLLSRIKPSFRLIVTDGYTHNSELVNSFVAKARKMGVADRLRLEGPANQERLRELYAGARALIHPSVEAFGMTALEAASQGCPFIMPKGSGVTEIFSHGVQGFFPNEEDEDSYVDYINRFDDESFAREMGRLAWEVSKEYSWSNHAKKLEQVILSHL